MDLATAVRYVTAGYERHTLKVGGTEVLVEPYGTKDLAVVFRGSDKLDDWWTNLDAGMVRFFGSEEAYVHGGFLSSYGAARADLFTLLYALDTFQRKTIHVLGHSQGGSKGLLFAADLLQPKPDGLGPLGVVYKTEKIKVRTFGCPNTGNAAFNEILADVDVDQYEHGYDPVPSVPPELFGFKKLRFPTQGWSWWHTWLPVIRRMPSRIGRDHLWKNYARVFG